MKHHHRFPQRTLATRFLTFSLVTIWLAGSTDASLGQSGSVSSNESASAFGAVDHFSSKTSEATGGSHSTTAKERRPARPSAGNSSEFADWLAGAKLTEEGEGNLQQALEEYQRVIAEFDRLRPMAADALVRIAEINRKLGKVDEAGVAYARVLREFTDHAELAALALDRMRAWSSSPARKASAPMPPVRMREVFYPDAGYSRSQIPFGGTGSMSSNAGNYGSDDVFDSPRAHALLEDLDSIRKEARAVNNEIRRVERELRAARNRGLSEIPLRFVEDPHLIELVNTLEHTRESLSVIDDASNARKREEEFVRQQAQATEYFQSKYLPRLATSLELLNEDLARLRAEISDREEQLAKLRQQRQDPNRQK